MDTTGLRGDRRRSVATALVALLVAGMLAVATGTPGAGAQADETTPAEAAGSWLADQFVDGERFETVFGDDVFFDYGGTVDAIIALAAAGVADDTAAAATDWLEESAQTDAYAGDGSGSNQSGGLAKLALLAQTRGLDARHWGVDDVDLIERLLAMEDDGRFVDVPDFGDDFKTFSHAFAIMALVRQGDAAPSDASLELLLTSQCADGGFDGDLDEDPADCTSGVDSTATALLALLAADRGDDAEEIADAVAFLLDVQAADGSFANDTGANANSTGLATYALRLAGETGAADAAAAFLLTLQQGCDAPESERGAIDVDGGEFDPGSAARATSQALYGIAGLGYLDATAAGATTDQPRFDCTVADPEPDPEPAVPTPVDGRADDVDPVATPAPAATPTAATPSFTG